MKKFAVAVPGSIVTRATAPAYITRLYRFHAIQHDLTLEASIMIQEVEQRIVSAGLMSWADVEAAELAALHPVAAGR